MKDPLSVEARMDRVKNAFAGFNCMETLHSNARTLPKDGGHCRHRRYPGSCNCNVLGPAVFASYEDCWNLRVGDKKLV